MSRYGLDHDKLLGEKRFLSSEARCEDKIRRKKKIHRSPEALVNVPVTPEILLLCRSCRTSTIVP